jgi:uncharacterized protein YjdB
MKTTHTIKTNLFYLVILLVIPVVIFSFAGCKNPFTKELIKPKEETAAVTGVRLKASTSIAVGGTETLTATVEPANAANKAVNWSSDNESIASVADGVVSAHTPGTAEITVTTVDGGFTASCTATVVLTAVAVTGVQINKTSVGLAVGGTETLTPTIHPVNATNQAVTWLSSDDTIAAVSANGVISGAATGTAEITVTTMDGGFTAICTVIVGIGAIPVTGVTLNKESTNIAVGEYEILIAAVVPSDASHKNVNWTSSDETVATVDQGGVVIAELQGTATITVATAEGDFTAACEVTVTAPAVPVTGVSLKKASTAMLVNGTETLVAIVTPANATNKNIAWTSSNTGIAAVSDGTITAVSVGTAVITATSDADGAKSASCTVTVSASEVAVTWVSLDKSSAVITSGDTEDLIETIIPAGATNQNVTWSSSNTSVAAVSNGTVTAHVPGTAAITVSTVDGGLTATCAVTVNPVWVRGVVLNKTSAEIIDGTTETLTATVLPLNATNKNVLWTSNNPDVATVSGGTVAAHAVGSTEITVTTTDGRFTAICAVSVAAASIVGVSLNKYTTDIVLGETETLTATVFPANATDKSVTWSSDDSSIASVSVSGVVTAHALGTTFITVSTTDGGKTAACAVTVKPAAPAAPTVIAGFGQLSLSWTAVALATEYEVYYSTGDTIPDTPAQTVPGTTATITSLTNGATYSVWLKTKAGSVVSAASAMASGKPTGVGLYHTSISEANKIGNQNLADALANISANAVTGQSYFIVLGADENITPKSLSYSNKTVGITLMGEGSRTVQLSGNGSLFTLANGVTLVLDSGITLKGHSSNTASLARVNSGGTLTMKDNAVISGNTSSYGGVYVSNGTFTMEGGEISGNTASSYGGGCMSPAELSRWKAG